MTSVTARAALIGFCRNRLLLAPFLEISLFYPLSTVLSAQEQVWAGEFHVDSDHDGMSDTLEQALLVQFVRKRPLLAVWTICADQQMLTL